MRLYLTDHLGSTRAVVDDAGTVLETFDYYPFGLLMPKRNTAGANTIEKFTGKERDEEDGLNLDYFGARYYDAALGRWHGVDPLAEIYPDLSPYNYTLNNPIAFVDPDGRAVVETETSFIYTGEDAENLFRQLRDGQKPKDKCPDCKEQRNTTTQQSSNTASAAAVAVFSLDVSTPDPTDAILLKWGVWGVVIGGAIIIDQTGLLDTNISFAEGDLKRLSDDEIEALQEGGIDIHDLKGKKGASKRDLFKDKEGNIEIRPRDGRGPGEPTNLNIKDFM